MTLEFIARQLDHRYRVLQRSLGHGLTDELARKKLGERPSIAWHAQHLAEAMASTLEAVALGPGTARPFPTSFEDQGLPDLVSELNRRSSEVLSALKSLTDDDLERPPLVDVQPAFRSTLTSRMVFLEGHLFHVTYHLGAIGLLRAEWQLAP